jgi:hypothetical protein
LVRLNPRQGGLRCGEVKARVPGSLTDLNEYGSTLLFAVGTAELAAISLRHREHGWPFEFAVLMEMANVLRPKRLPILPSHSQVLPLPVSTRWTQSRRPFRG